MFRFNIEMQKKSIKIKHLHNINFTYDKGIEFNRWKDLPQFDSKKQLRIQWSNRTERKMYD